MSSEAWDFEPLGDGIKEWRSVVRGADGKVVVTVTVSDGTNSSKWSVRSSKDMPAHRDKMTLRKAIVECRKQALEALDEISDLDLSKSVKSAAERAAEAAA